MRFLSSIDQKIFGRLDRIIDNSFLGRAFAALKAALAPAEDSPGPVDGRDWIAATLLGCVALAVACWAMSHVPESLYRVDSLSSWFQGDQSRLIESLKDRTSNWHYRDSVHPLFSLLAFPPVAILRGLGLSPLAAGLALIGATAFVSVVLLHQSLRHLGLSRTGAALGSLAFVSSATFMHWYGTVETFAMSGLTAILCIYLFVRVKDVGIVSAVLGSAATLAMVTTNWMLGIALVGMKFPLSRFLRYTIMALALCVAAAVAQKLIFPHANFFFYPSAVMAESQYVALDESGRAMPPARVIETKPRAFFISAAVAPAPYADMSEHGQIIGNQDSAWSSYGIVGAVAVIAWLVMLLVSLVDLVASRRLTPILVGIIAFIVGQFALHLVYGELVFLYVADYFIALIVIASMGSAGRWKRIHIAASCCFILAGAITNADHFVQATQLVEQGGTAAH